MRTKLFSYRIVKIFLQNLDRYRQFCKKKDRHRHCLRWKDKFFITFVGRGVERSERFEMFIFPCIDVAPYRRVFRKLCLLLPMLLVKMPGKHRMCFRCKIFVSRDTESKSSILCSKIYSRRII